jgi:hypothetical protein
VARTTVTLLDLAGRWTPSERHGHHEFPTDVPDGTIELRVRLWWDPLDMGDEHLANSLALTIWDAAGFRGGAVRRGDANDLRIGWSDAAPGAIPGPIRPGRWLLNLETGLILPDGDEAGYLDWTLQAWADVGDPAPTVASGPGRQPARRSASGSRWYRGDLHSHTTHSDGDISVPERVQSAVARGLDFLAITDHNTVSHHAEMVDWPDELIPIRGSEITTYHGHINVWGLGEAIDWRGDRRGGGAEGILEAAHRQGALASINHPSAFGDPWCVGCHWDFARVDYAQFDGMEVWNGRWAIPETDDAGALALWTDLLDAGFRLTAVSGSDSHSAEEDAYIALPSTYAFADEATEAAILDAIRRGRVILSSGPWLSFRAVGPGGVAVTLPSEELPGDLVDLVVEIDDVEAPATLWFVTTGARLALGTCAPGSTRVARDGLAAGAWWRLELRLGSTETGDLLTLTNPVFRAPA